MQGTSIPIPFRQDYDCRRENKDNIGQSLLPSVFPFIFDDDLMKQYQEHQKAYSDIFVMLAGIITSSCFVIMRCNLMHSFDDGLFFICAFFASTISYFLFTGLVLCFLIKYCSFNKKSILCKVSEFILNTPQLIDQVRDLMTILGTSGLSLGLLGRVANGQCVVDVSLWEAQRCNPAAASFGLPHDHVIFLILSPLLIQAMVNGMTYRGTLICWCISTSALVACAIYVRGRLEMLSFVSCLSILVLIYRYEKLGRITFLNIKNTAAAEIEKRGHILLQQSAEHDLLSEKIKHELEIWSMKAHEECRLMEREQQQMVAMIGNIAHDLKTPLQSFLMDLESLKTNEGFCGCKYFFASLLHLHPYNSSFISTFICL